MMKKIILTLFASLLMTNYLYAQIVAAQKGENGKWGFVDANGNWVVSPQYDYTYWGDRWKFGTFTVRSISQDSKGMIDEKGKVIFPIGNYKSFYRYQRENSQYLEVTNLEGKKGLATMDGKLLIPCYYKGFNLYHVKDNNFILAKEENDLQCVYDVNGRKILPAKYANYSFYYYKESKVIEVENKEGLKGVITAEGKELVPCLYKAINMASIKDKGIILAKEENDLQCVYDINGKNILPAKYADYSFYYYKESKVIEVKNKEGLKGVITAEGKELVPCLYMDINMASFKDNGVILAMEGNDLQCVYDANGKKIIPAKYTDYSFLYYKEKGVIVASKKGMKGLLNGDTGQEVVSFSYTNVFVWDKYIQTVDDRNGEKYGVYTLDGKLVAPCEYTSVGSLSEDIVSVCRGGHKENNKVIGGRWGYCAGGKEVIPCIYDEVSAFQDNVAKVKKDGEVKLIKNPLKDSSQIQIANGNKSSRKKEKGPVVSRYPAPDSDVDKNIPTATVSADNTFAFIIANENYPDAPVPYSLNDGRMFKEYCQKALGLPEKNINLYEDATFGNIITAVEKMKQIADAYDGNPSVIFYYAGHGFPDEKQNTAYLLPIDGNASDITTTGYSLAKLYQELSELKLKSSIVFLDACFSGTKREDQMLSESRGVAIKVKEEAPKGNMLVFSAAQGDETAHQMEEKHHGLFTYYLLKELQATGGDVDMGTLTEYVTKQVKRQSVVINNKKQTPTVIPSQTLSSSWQSMKLK